MATKKTIAGDQIGKLWTGLATNTPQPLFVTVTDATKGSKVIALTTVQLGGNAVYVAVSREFVKEQRDNATNKSSAGNQLLLDAKYASVNLDVLASAAELSTLQINAWSNPAVIAANSQTDFGNTTVCTAKIGFSKFNHGAEITGLDYDDSKSDNKTPEQLAADAAAEAAAKRNKILLIVGAALLAGIVIYGFATDWKFGKKSKKKDK